ncbi:MAG: ACP S-malonyltransferase [Anaerovorax sp.]
MKIGLLFAGQGAQHTGMGKSLYEQSQSAREMMDRAGDQVKEWCFFGTKEMLRQTNITQPCIYTVTMAAYAGFQEELFKLSQRQLEQIKIVGFAGFSLGEYAALTASGVMKNFQQGLEIVKNRGAWMNEAGLDEKGEAKGGMVAAFGDRTHVLDCVNRSRCSDILECVNFNSPIQTVVAGSKEALERFKVNAKALGGMKAIPLSVSTAFHSSMMEPAVPKLTALLKNSGLRAPNVTIYSNVTGKNLMEKFETTAELPENQGDYIAEMMGKQAMSPVYWQETIENMIEEGVDLFIEIGPGSTLSGLVKKINHEVMTLNISDYETLMKTMEELRGILC